jgi:hypothetical protein
MYPKREERLGRLEQKLQRAQTVTPKLMSDVIAQACVRFATHGGPATTARVDRLIESGAWTDAALALVELELRQWIASSSHLRGRRVALLALEAADSSRWAR